MKAYAYRCLLVSQLIVNFSFATAGPAAAQTLKTLHVFTAGSDGANPEGSLILWGNTLYGTTTHGGPQDNGTVFAVNTDGTGFTNLYAFTGGADGRNPRAGLTLLGGTLYGTAQIGGAAGEGTVFAINSDGTGFSTVQSFGSIPRSGVYPYAGLALSGNVFYGTTQIGGWGYGTVFMMNSDGGGFTNVHIFGSSDGGPGDGADLYSGLVLSGNTLYGTAADGTGLGSGTVFAVNTDGTGFTNLYNFTAEAHPYAGLILSGDTLYGTTADTGLGTGTVFAVNIDGTGFTNLFVLQGAPGPSEPAPAGGLLLLRDTLYGTTLTGGDSGFGNVFALKTDGSGYRNLYSFTGDNDGAYPRAGLILSGYKLCGTTSGSLSGRTQSGFGTVFSLAIEPQLAITNLLTSVVLSWPTNFSGFDYSGFTLQSATNLVSPAVWVNVSPGPVIVGGQNTVTNLISGGQRFYRLVQ